MKDKDTILVSSSIISPATEESFKFQMLGYKIIAILLTLTFVLFIIFNK